MLWGLEDYKRLFLLVGVIGILLISSPLLFLLVPSQASEQFSELYLLGPNRLAEDYPFTIESGQPYSLYLGVTNHQGTPSYYLISVKLRNQTQPPPNATTTTPSALPAIINYKVFLGDAETWEQPLTFALEASPLQGNYCMVDTLSIGGFDHAVETLLALDSEYSGYFVELFFELWIFRIETQSFAFHNRWVGLWLNVTCGEQ